MTDASYVEDYLRTLGRFGVKPGLERVQALLSGLYNPERAFRVVHVAGSNGKGSTASFVAAGLQQSGLRTGLYTSPHLVSYNERIRVDGSPVANARLRDYVDRLKPVVERIEHDLGSPTEFDVGTAMAFLHFATEKVDAAVIETGLGGRWDSTNIVDPALSIITPITVDHTEILGTSVAEIAGEKAGIIKRGAPVVLSPQPESARAVLVEHAKKQAAPLFAVSVAGDQASGEQNTFLYEPLDWSSDGGKVSVTCENGNASIYEVGMLGSHQLQNAAVAASALHVLRDIGWPITYEAVHRALRTTQVAGRLEVLQRDPVLLLDGAHNELGAEQLSIALQHLYAKRPITLVCGMSKDKAAERILRPLIPYTERVITTQASASRLGSWSAEDLSAMVSAMQHTSVAAVPKVMDALEMAKQHTSPEGVVCVMGSLYLVGEVRALLVGSEAE